MDEKIGLIRFELVRSFGLELALHDGPRGLKREQFFDVFQSKLRYENVEIFKILEKLHKTVKHLHRTSTESLEMSGEENEPPFVQDIYDSGQNYQSSSTSPDVDYDEEEELRHVGQRRVRQSYDNNNSSYKDDEEDEMDSSQSYSDHRQVYFHPPQASPPAMPRRHCYHHPMNETVEYVAPQPTKRSFTSGVQKSVNQHLKKAIITIKKHKPMNIQHGGFSQPKVLSPVTISPLIDRKPSLSRPRNREREDYYERQQLIENLNDLKAELDLHNNSNSNNNSMTHQVIRQRSLLSPENNRSSLTSSESMNCPKSFCRQHLVKLVSSGDKPMACRLVKTTTTTKCKIPESTRSSEVSRQNSLFQETSARESKMLCEKNLQLIRIKLNSSQQSQSPSANLVNNKSCFSTSSSCSSTTSNNASSSSSNPSKDLTTVCNKNAQKLANNSNYVYYQHMNNQNNAVKRHLLQNQMPFCNEIFYI